MKTLIESQLGEFRIDICLELTKKIKKAFVIKFHASHFRMNSPLTYWLATKKIDRLDQQFEMSQFEKGQSTFFSIVIICYFMRWWTNLSFTLLSKSNLTHFIQYF